jgi:hypothetical protein
LLEASLVCVPADADASIRSLGGGNSIADIRARMLGRQNLADVRSRMLARQLMIERMSGK